MAAIGLLSDALEGVAFPEAAEQHHGEPVLRGQGAQCAALPLRRSSQPKALLVAVAARVCAGGRGGGAVGGPGGPVVGQPVGLTLAGAGSQQVGYLGLRQFTWGSTPILPRQARK